MREIKRGQISTEYLIVMAFVTFLIISTLGIGLFYSAQAKDRIKFNYIENFANKIISSAESVYYAGEPSKATVTAYLPPNVQSIEVLQNEIVFSIATSSGVTRISYSSDVPIEGSLSSSEGMKRIVISALSDRVVLNE